MNAQISHEVKFGVTTQIVEAADSMIHHDPYVALYLGERYGNDFRFSLRQGEIRDLIDALTKAADTLDARIVAVPHECKFTVSA